MSAVNGNEDMLNLDEIQAAPHDVTAAGLLLGWTEEATKAVDRGTRFLSAK